MSTNVHLQPVIFTESFFTVRALIGTLTYKIKESFPSEKSKAAKQACTVTPPAPDPGHHKHSCIAKKRLRQSTANTWGSSGWWTRLSLLRRGCEPRAIPALRNKQHSGSLHFPFNIWAQIKSPNFKKMLKRFCINLFCHHTAHYRDHCFTDTLFFKKDFRG